MLPRSSHCTHSVAHALRHTDAAVLIQQHPEDVMRKPEDPRDGVTQAVRFSIEI